ncbi:MAG: hypothetical protein GY821_08715 [Gammaproteobacteria bacterium]|nr:hypothetical protein [Gammaproteobacteria bacterium]
MILWLVIILLLLAVAGLFYERQRHAKTTQLNDVQRQTFNKIRLNSLLFTLYVIHVWVITLIAMKIRPQLFFLWLLLLVVPAVYNRLRKYQQMKTAKLPRAFVHLELQSLIFTYALITIVVAIFAYQLPDIPQLWAQLTQKISHVEGITITQWSQHSATTSTSTRPTTPISPTKVFFCPDINTMIKSQYNAGSWPYRGVNWFIEIHDHNKESGGGFWRVLATPKRGELICFYMLATPKKGGSNFVRTRLDIPYGVVITPAGANWSWSTRGDVAECKASPNGCGFKLLPAKS